MLEQLGRHGWDLYGAGAGDDKMRRDGIRQIL